MQLVKLNKNYQSDPNVSVHKIEINKNDLILFFDLNYFIFDFKEDQIGRIIFHNCYSYRIGNPNDEGFSFGDNELWNNTNFSYGEIEWNCFYEVQNTPKLYLENFIKIGKKDFDQEKLKHYVFFMKEKTFECLAESYEENIKPNG